MMGYKDGQTKVSVIIPVYQVEDYLERAVSSVLEQTLEDLEIILVDDGSQDASGDICDAFAKAYPDKVRVIHKENQGLGMARNSGTAIARGEYIAFLDSDDTIEPEMYREMYDKAEEGAYDIVMCDVRIIYADRGQETISVSYPDELIDIAGYIAKGNNITYSVNKLYRRSIWKENQYEKMLFEDIALIPSMITRYPNIGYVKKAFYNYHRRANTISTTQTGAMTDIIAAYDRFLKNSAREYREETVYCIAKQLYWNMTDSRVLFLPDFITFLKENKTYFLLNDLIRKDPKIKWILEQIDRTVIPDRVICADLSDEGPCPEFLEDIRTDFPSAELILCGKGHFREDDLPESVQRAAAQGKRRYVEEYASLRILAEKGGIVVFPDMKPNLKLKKLRMDRCFFGFEDQEEISCGCFGAIEGHYVIRGLLDSYTEDNVFNKALLPLSERVRDFLILHFQLRVNGRNQLLKKEVQVYLPSILAYDMQDGENCCRHRYPSPEGFQVISDTVLKMWSDRLMENWNLYKQARAAKGPGTVPAQTKAAAAQAELSGKTEERIRAEAERLALEKVRETAEKYEQSTCWKITKPLRILGSFFGKEQEAGQQ